MSFFERLAIGTANWGEKPYGHRGVTCPRSEQEKIIEYCMSAGIHTIDTAVAYGVDLSWLPRGFNVVTKVREQDPVVNAPAIDSVLAHDLSTWFSERHRGHCDGVSLYDPEDWARGRLAKSDELHILQVPYSPFDHRWEHIFPQQTDYGEVHVRSCFVQGKVFHSQEPVFVRFRQFAHDLRIPVGALCILFCFLNPNVDKVILGVDSEEQLRDNLHGLNSFGVDDPSFFHRLDSFAVDDSSVIDPRNWDKRDPVDRVDRVDERSES